MAFDLIAAENRLWATGDPVRDCTNPQPTKGVRSLPQAARMAELLAVNA